MNYKFLLIESLIEKSLKHAINENLSISKEVESEAEIIKQLIKNELGSKPFLKDIYNLNVKSGSFQHIFFDSVQFTINYEITYFNSEDEFVEYHNNYDFDSLTSFEANSIFIRSAFLRYKSQFDVLTFDSAISHEIMHVYEFYKQGDIFLFDKYDKNLYKTAISILKKLEQDIGLLSSKLEIINNKLKDENNKYENISLMQEKYDILDQLTTTYKQQDIVKSLYYSFNHESMAFLHGFNEDIKKWNNFYIKNYKQTDLYKVLVSMKQILQDKNDYKELIVDIFKISPEKYFKIIENGYNYLNRKIGKVVGRTFFDFPDKTFL